MKTRLYVIYILCLIVLAACEKEVEFKAPDVEAASDITLNGIAVEGEPLTIYLNKAYSIGNTPLLNIGYQFAFSKNDALIDYQTAAYYKKTAILDAEVQAVVNNQQTYTLTLAADSMGYVCDYHPQVGDHIEIKAGNIRVETTVPPRPQIEILSHEVLEENPYKYIEGMSYENDTIMRITCRIPTSNINQYYRLRVRGERKYSYTWGAYYPMQDIYFSEDELFVDDRLSFGFGGWPAYFSNVFDKNKIEGTDHTFTINSPKSGYVFNDGARELANKEIMEQQLLEPDIPPRVMVELQAISPEFYHYLKSVELFRITESDAFSEPVQIYSNVQNGWGILGALSYDRHFVEYGE